VSDLSLKYLLLGEDRTASKSIKGVADTAEKSSSLIDGASKAWAAGAALAGAAVVKFGADTVAAASDQNEVVSKSSVIFGKNADDILSWASTADKSMGLSKTSALEAASGFGDMFLQLGFAGDQATGMSKQVVQLAADLGSFNNLPTAEVADMMAGAFRGEYDSLQRLVPNINAARVETQALAMTGKKNASELTAQEKAAATLAIVTKDSARAQGDFARTSGGLANSQKILQAEFENTQAQLGQKLLPAVTAVTHGLTSAIGVVGNVVDEVSSLPAPVLAGAAAMAIWRLAGDRIIGVAGRGAGPIKAWGESFRLAGLYAKDAGGGLAGLKAGLSSMTGGVKVGQAAMGGLKAVGSGLFGLMGGPWGIALTAATAGLTLWMQAQADAKAYADELTATLDKQTGAFTENSRSSIVKKIMGDLSPEDVALVQQLGINFGQLADAAIAGGPAFDDQRAKLVALVNEHQKGIGAFTAEGRATEGLLQSFLRSGDAANGARIQQEALAKAGVKTGDAATDAAGSSDIFAGAMDAVGAAAKGASVDMSEVNKQLAEYYSRNMDAADASIAYEAAVDDAAKALKENGRTLDINTAKGRANKSALLDLAKAAGEQSRKTLEAGGSMSTASKQIDTARTKFIKLAMQMNGGNRKAAEDMANKFGLTKDAVRAMNGEINKTPPAKKTTVTVPTQPATRQAQSIRAEIAAIKGKTVPITLSVGASMSSAARSLIAGVGGIGHLVAHAGNARGTASWRGGLTWVGEQGPELVKVPGGSRIYDANTSQAMARGGGSGGGDINLTVNLRSPDGRLLWQELLKVKRQSGPLGLEG
jgi:hypothetical protein